MLVDHDLNNSTEPRIYVCGTGATQPSELYLRVGLQLILTSHMCLYDPWMNPMCVIIDPLDTNQCCHLQASETVKCHNEA